METFQSLVTLAPWTFIAQICNLLIQMLLIKKFLIGPVKAVLEKRRAQTNALIQDAAEAKEAAEALKSDYEKTMSDARAEANELVQSSSRAAAKRSEEIVGEAREQAARLRQKADEDIERERRKAMSDAKNEIGSIAMEIASKVVEREINEKDHEALIEEFIRNVGEAS
jgi:F-type H+-transporting ATPase subunit b